MTQWRQRWRQNILHELHSGYCETQMGEEIGWLMSPLLDGFYQGYLTTSETEWIDHLVDCVDAWVRRGVKEPDGYLGWPKIGAAGTDVDRLNDYYADSLVGEALVLRPVLQMSAVILKDRSLTARYGRKAEDFVRLGVSVFRKWESRGAWRAAGVGMISVVLPFGIDPKTDEWSDGYRDRDAPGKGFSHPDNKANLVALWLLALSDATGDGSYAARAEKWFTLMKARMKFTETGTSPIWNYWEPAGVWDYRTNGTPKHWVGVHPNAGYYTIDVGAIVAAYEHGLVFTADDIRRLIATASANGRVWPALAPYSEQQRTEFMQSVNPDGWTGLYLVPWYLSLLSQHSN